MQPHHCFVDDDRKAIPCLCVRGVDHTEDEFDVPLPSEPDNGAYGAYQFPDSSWEGA